MFCTLLPNPNPQRLLGDKEGSGVALVSLVVPVVLLLLGGAQFLPFAVLGVGDDIRQQRHQTFGCSDGL